MLADGALSPGRVVTDGDHASSVATPPIVAPYTFAMATVGSRSPETGAPAGSAQAIGFDVDTGANNATGIDAEANMVARARAKYEARVRNREGAAARRQEAEAEAARIDAEKAAKLRRDLLSEQRSRIRRWKDHGQDAWREKKARDRSREVRGMLEKDKRRQRNQRRAMEKRREALLQERLQKVMELDTADGGAATAQPGDSKTAQGDGAGGKHRKKKKRRRRRDGDGVAPGSVDDYDPTRADAMANDWAAHEDW